MSTYKINISRIEKLITEYVKENSIDNHTQALVKIVEKLKNTSFPCFMDIAVLSGILHVSPDYISGVSDNPEYDDPYIIQILSSVYEMNDDYKAALAEKAAQYINIQENIVNFEKAGIEVFEYDSAGNVYSKAASHNEPYNVLRIADDKVHYGKDDENKGSDK